MIPEGPVKVGICGSFQTGKSALVNCLLGRRVASQGFGKATTALPTSYCWGDGEHVKLVSSVGATIRSWRTIEGFHADSERLDLRQHGSIVVTLTCPLLREVTLVDTPGFDANQLDNAVLEQTLHSLDYILFLQGNQKELREEEARWIRGIANYCKPFSLIINCNENLLDHEGNSWWDPGDRRNSSLKGQVHKMTHNRLGACPLPIAGSDVLLCNILWHLCGLGLLDPEDLEGRRWFSRVEAHFNGRLPSPDELALKSGVGLIHDFLSADGWRAVSPQKVHCLARLHRSISDWHHKLEGSIGEMEAVLSQLATATGQARR